MHYTQARTNVDREIFIFLVQLTTCRIGNPVDPYSCYMCDHKCIVLHTLTLLLLLFLTFSVMVANPKKTTLLTNLARGKKKEGWHRTPPSSMAIGLYAQYSG